MRDATKAAGVRKPCASAMAQLAGLPAETLRELDAISRVRSYAAGEIVADAGVMTDFVGIVVSGYFRMQKTLFDGRQHIVGLLVEGDMFGQVLDGPLSLAIEAASDADICAFQRKPFEALLLRSPELERFVMLNILNELDRARDWMIILANPKVSTRLAGFLLILCTRFAQVDHILRVDGNVIDVQIPIGRNDLAHLLGTRPETISRAFHALADSGLITIKRPDLVQLMDVEALAEEAGEDGSPGMITAQNVLAVLRDRSREQRQKG